MEMKRKKTFGWYIANRLFAAYNMLLILYLTLTGIPVFTNGINRTVGWLWISTSINFIITYYTLVVYFFALLILYVFKRETNKILSKIFMFCLGLIFIYDSFFERNYLVVGYFKVLVFVLFLVLFFSVLLKKEKII